MSDLQTLGVAIFDDGAWNDITELSLQCQMQLSMPLYYEFIYQNYLVDSELARVGITG